MNNINESFFLTIVSLCFALLLVISFSIKRKVINNETKTFFLLLIELIISIVSESILAIFYSYSFFIKEFTMKVFLLCIVAFVGTLLYYLGQVIYEKHKLEYFKKILLLIYSLFSIVLCILPTEYVYDGDILLYSTGVSVSSCLYFVSFSMITILAIIIKNKKLNNLKFLPIYAFILLMIIAAIIQKLFPSILLDNLVFCVTLFIMYQTIENPDIKLIEYERKEIDKIKQAAESKSEFLSSTSHELRTPLNAIIGLSEDIESFKEINPEILDDVKDLVNASNVLLDIISNILDSSKIESGKLDIVECDYDVKNELETIGNIYKIKAFKKNLQLNIEIDENIPQILYGDRQRIKQVISNLLDNAVKFTDVGKINYIVKWDNLKSNLIITISDSGDGLRKEEIETFLNEQKDLRIEKIYSAQGTGLGLTISRNLIKLLKGYATIDTKIYAGTKFTIYIPQKIGDIEILNAMNKKVDIDINSLNYTGKRLLVVDDNPINIKVLRKAIKSFNFEIEECYNGKDAIDRIELNNNYDLVFMDIMMPVMGGEEAIKKLREMANFTTPVVALTADAVSGATQKYKNMGFNDYMSKPFSRDMVANKLYSVLGRGDINE